MESRRSCYDIIGITKKKKKEGLLEAQSESKS